MKININEIMQTALTDYAIDEYNLSLNQKQLKNPTLKSLQQTLNQQDYQNSPYLITALQHYYHKLYQEREYTTSQSEFRKLSKPIDVITAYFAERHLMLTGINLELNQA